MSKEANDSWTSTDFRVRYAETDQMGVVYYANYFVWFEIGRMDFCRQPWAERFAAVLRQQRATRFTPSQKFQNIFLDSSRKACDHFD